jgi:hypothetical protein
MQTKSGPEAQLVLLQGESGVLAKVAAYIDLNAKVPMGGLHTLRDLRSGGAGEE